MALRCYSLSFENPWLNEATFHEVGAGTEASGDTAPDVYEIYKKEVIGKLKDPEQKKALNDFIDSAQSKKVTLEGLAVILEPLIDTLKASEHFSELAKRDIAGKLTNILGNKEITKDEVKELIQIRFKEERRMLLEEISNDQLEDSTIYLKRADGTRVSKGQKDTAFALKKKYTIDFGIKEDGVTQADAILGQNKTRLDHMVPKEVTQVQLVSLKNKETVTLFRCNDDKFREAGKTSGSWYPVYQGDVVTILERSDKTPSTPLPEANLDEATATTPGRSMAEMQAEARTRQGAYQMEQADLEAGYVKLAAGGRTYEQKADGTLDLGHIKEEDYGSLRDGVSRTLDASLTGWSAADFDRNVDEMEYGEDFKRSLNRMAKAGGQSSGMELWKDIYNGEGKKVPDTIDFTDVCTAAMGKDSANLRLEYLSLTEPDGDIAYYTKELEDEKEKKTTGESDENRNARYDARIDALEAKRPEMIEADKAREARIDERIKELEAKMEGASPERQEKLKQRISALEESKANTKVAQLDARIAELEAAKANDREARLQARLEIAIARKNQIDEFYKGAVVFMASVEHLSFTGDKAAAQKEDPKMAETIAGLKEVRGVCDLLFLANDGGPIVKPTFWEALFKGDQAHMLTMDLTEGKAYRTGFLRKADTADFFQEKASEKGAWTLLEHMGVTYAENGEVKVDKVAFLAAVNEMLTMGVPFLKNEEDWKDEAERYLPEKPQFKNWEDMMKSLTLDTPIQADMAKEFERRGYNHDAKSTYREAIRYGMGVKLGLEVAKNREDEKAYQEKPIEGDQAAVAAAVERVEKTTGMHLTEAQRAEIAANMHEYYLGMIGVMRRDSGDVSITGLGFDAQRVLLNEPRIVLHGGVNGNVYSEEIEAHIGVTAEIVKRGRFELQFVGGANAGASSMDAGLGLQAGVKLDNHEVYELNFGATTLITPIGLAAALNLGVDRDMASVLVKKTDKLVEANQDQFSLEMAKTKEVLAATGMSDADVALMEKQMNAMFIQQMGDHAVEDLKTFQFLGVGVTYITPMPPLLPTGLVMPYIKVGIKGKEYTVYKPSGVDMDSVMQQRINQQVAEQSKSPMVLEISKSGSTLLNSNGERIIGQSSVEHMGPGTQLEGPNEILADQGIHLEAAYLADGKPALRIEVSKVDGKVDMYVDPKSGMQLVNEGGQVYLVWNGKENLHFTRTDSYTGFEDQGTYHRVGLYITDNPAVPLDTIRRESHSHLNYSADLAGNITGPVKEVTDQADLARDVLKDDQGQERVVNYANYKEKAHESGVDDFGRVEHDPAKDAIYQSLDEAMAAGLNLGAEDPKSKEALQRITSAMEAEAKSTELTPAKATIDGYASKMMELKDARLSYKALSLDGNHKNVAELVKTQYPNEGWSAEAMTYMIQRLMVESLSISDAEVVTEWNTEAIKKILAPLPNAEEIARKIVKYFNENMDHSKKIPEGSTLQVLVGTEGIEGYRESNWSGGEGSLLGSATLKRMGLTDSEIVAVNDILTERLAPLPEGDPEALMRSQLGLGVLTQAHKIFKPEVALRMAELWDRVRLGSIHSVSELSSPELQKAYANFAAMVTTLRKDKRYDHGDIHIKVDTEKAIGLFDQCKNFATYMIETITVTETGGSVSAVGAEGVDTLTGHNAVDVTGLGITASYSADTPPPPGTPKERIPDNAGDGTQTTIPEIDPSLQIGNPLGTDHDDANTF